MTKGQFQAAIVVANLNGICSNQIATVFKVSPLRAYRWLEGYYLPRMSERKDIADRLEKMAPQ